MKVFCRICSLLIALLVGVSDVRAEQVVFNEIMYHPPDDLPEYIEVYNNTATPFDIAEWRLCEGVEYVFPPFAVDAIDRTFLKPFERILLSGVDEAALITQSLLPGQTRREGRSSCPGFRRSIHRSSHPSSPRSAAVWSS